MIRILLFLLVSFPFLCYSQLTEKEGALLRQELTKKINDLRISKGLNPLIFNDTLKKAAEYHSEYMVKHKKLSHEERPLRYRFPAKRVKAFKGTDFQLVGENILFSTPQNFPLSKNKIKNLAEEMYTSWFNSPGHYANMTEPEYVYGAIGFKSDFRNNIVYATHVFGTKGYVVANQFSKNSFGLLPANKDCENIFNTYSNIVMNMGNNIEVVGNEIFLYFYNVEYFDKIFSSEKDGIAIDLVSRKQFDCSHPNQLDMSLVYDGILLNPTYSKDLKENNRAKSDYRIITKVGEIPEHLDIKEYSPSVIIIKDGKSCKYVRPGEVPSRSYRLKLIEPIVKDDSSTQLVNNGVVFQQTLQYDFKTDQVQSIQVPKIELAMGQLKSIYIKSYSSVEGDSLHNVELHTARANYIKNSIKKKLNAKDETFVTDVEENWEKMNFQLTYFNLEEMTKLSHDSIKILLNNRNDSIPWDSLLHSQRKSTATINYWGAYDKTADNYTFEEFNLRTGVAIENSALVNKALYKMYQSKNYDPAILFETFIVDFIKEHPNTVGNYTALLASNYRDNPYFITDFIYSCIHKRERLSSSACFNILHLYSLVGTYLLDNWDVSAERLSNVIHPLKMKYFIDEDLSPELVLNLHLTFIEYFGQINDGENISVSFNYIAKYFKENTLSLEDDVALALFFNKWSMFQMTKSHLLNRFENNDINQEGLFTLAKTMSFMDIDESSDIYLEVNKKLILAIRVDGANG